MNETSLSAGTNFLDLEIYKHEIYKITCQILQEFGYLCSLDFVNHLIKKNARKSHLKIRISVQGYMTPSNDQK